MTPADDLAALRAALGLMVCSCDPRLTMTGRGHEASCDQQGALAALDRLAAWVARVAPVVEAAGAWSRVYANEEPGTDPAETCERLYRAVADRRGGAAGAPAPSSIVATKRGRLIRDPDGAVTLPDGRRWLPPPEWDGFVDVLVEQGADAEVRRG